MLKVEGHKNLYRNDTGAIVNTDTVEYNQYKRLKNKIGRASCRERV